MVQRVQWFDVYSMLPWFWCSDIYIFQSSVTIFNGSITSMLLCLQTIVLWLIDIMNTCLRLCFHWSLICMSITCKALHKRVRVMVFNATFKKYFSYIRAVSFIGVENRCTRRKPPACRKSLINFITSPERDSNSLDFSDDRHWLHR